MSNTTVGLLISDIEGSTRLLQQLGPSYTDVLLRHNELMRSAFASHGGEEHGNEGDSFFVTFPKPDDAVRAALDAQLSLASAGWPAGPPVRVRMGVHVGEVQRVAGAMVGLAIHEAARISAAAHGGQVLASAATARTVEDVGWRDLGEHRLKDIASPMRLFQLTHDGLDAEFPPLRSGGSTRVMLPAQASSFVGRAAELADLKTALASSRAFTVLGPGGSGKSRIALRAAADLGHRFADGVWFVDLAPVSDGSLVDAKIAATLGLGEDPQVAVADAIGTKTLLLVIDNCEHIVSAVATSVDTILRSCPGVTVFATSREPLGIAGEVLWRVPELEMTDAVDLFVQRARAVNARFVLTDQNRGPLEDLCTHLDRMPLALELAAARIGTLTVEQLAARLDQRFRLLSGGVRGGLERHRTLEATVDWSYDLLDEAAQLMLRRVAISAGGFTLELAERLSEDLDSTTVLDLVDQLVAKSLVLTDDRWSEPRYRLLETIRAYALARVDEAGERDEFRDRHLAAVARFAAEAEDPLWLGDPTTDWLVRCDAEEANVREAFEWALERDDIDRARQILMTFSIWSTARARSRETLEWAQRLYAKGGTDTRLAIVALLELFNASNCGAGTPEMVARAKDAVPALERSERPWLATLADAYSAVWSYDANDPAATEATIRHIEGCVERSRAFSDAATGWVLQALLWPNLDSGRLDEARRVGEEALELFRRAGLTSGESRMALNLARIGLRNDDLDDAWRNATQAVEAARSTGDIYVVIVASQLLADVAERRGDRRTALDLLVSVFDPAIERLSPKDAQAMRERIDALS